MTMLEITLTKGLVGKKQTQRKVVQALGLTKYGSKVMHSKSATICGMIDKVHHLVTIKECADKKLDKASTKKTAEKTSK